MKLFLNSTHLVRPSAVMALGISLFAVSSQQLGAVNPKYDPTEEVCPECEEDGDSTSSPTKLNTGSLHWKLKVGMSNLRKDGSFHDMARFEVAAGSRGSGDKSFSAMYRERFNDNAIGRTPVYLEIDAYNLQNDLSDPKHLEPHGTGDAEVIEKDGFVNQIVSDNAFTHVEKLSNGFRVMVWNKSDITLVKSGALYVAPDPAEVVPVQDITFTKPEITSGTRVLTIVTKENFGTNGQLVRTDVVTEDPASDTLTKKTYDGEGSGGTLLRKEHLIYTNRGAKAWDYTVERTVEEASLNADGTHGGLITVSHKKETYRDFTPPNTHTVFGVPGTSGDKNGGKVGYKRLVEEVIDPDGSALTTTTTYYEGTGNDYLDRRVKSIVRPDGSWEYYEYNDSNGSPSSTTKKYSSWLNVPITSYQNAKLEETLVAKNEVVVTTSVAGVQVSKKKTQRIFNSNGESEVTQSRWTGSEWAEQVSCYYPDGAAELLAGRRKWVQHEDGTFTHYEYATTNGNLVISEIKGAGSSAGITSGTKVTTTYTESYQAIAEEVRDVASNLVLSTKEAVLSYGMDAIGRPIKWVYNNNINDFSISQYGCCGLELTRDRSGATRSYQRDTLKRVFRITDKRSSTGEAVHTTTSISGNASNDLITLVQRSSVDGTQLVSETTQSLDRLSYTMKSPDADGDGNPEVTTRVIAHQAGTGSKTTVTAPDGGVSITDTYLDNRTQKVSGSAVTGSPLVFHSYSYGTHTLNGGGLYTSNNPANGGGTKTYRDQLGRTIRTEYTGGAYASTAYYPQTAAAGSKGKVHTVRDADETALAGSGSLVSYGYNARGERTSSTTQLSNSQQMVTTTEHDDVNDPDLGVAHRYRTWVNGVLTNTTLQSADGYKSKSTTLAGTSTSERSVPVDGAWTVTSTAANGAFSIQTYTDGLMVKSATYAAGATNLNTEHLTLNTASHDAFGRVLTATDARTGTVTYNGYNENGSVQSMTDAGNRTTAYTYDVMGRTTKVDAPDTTTVENGSNVTLANITQTSYYLTGQVAATWGDQTYSRLNLYDNQNRLVELRTYQDLAHGTEPTVATTGYASTKWNYNAQRGWLDNKRYDDNKGTDYTYTNAGRLKTREWSRTLSDGTTKVTTTYGYDQGQMVSTSYNDGVTQDVVYAYDNFGRPTTVTQGSGATSNQHAYVYEPVTLVLDKEVISYGNGLSRTLDRSQDSLLRPTGFQLMNGTTEEHATSYGYDAAGRLAGVHAGATYPAAPAAADFTYGYLENSGSLVESVTGPAHTVTNSYEATRNVLDVKSNATNGAIPSVISAFDYTVSALGQREDVARSGSAFSSAHTESWNYNAKGEVVTADHSTNNAFDRAYQFDGIGNRKKSADSLTLPATDNYTANALNQLEAANGATRVHDEDGNLTDDGEKLYVWDAENRLIEIKNKSDNSTVATYAYDYHSRRITKTVGSAVTNFIYDRWNPIAVFTGTTLGTSYTWGTDLSGRMQDAGGVGGLLAVNDGSATYYPTYDGNGNVSEYVDATGASVAHYEYDAFGQVTASGTMKDDFTHQFSTKQLDSESGLHYYGYRFYDSVNGRWLGRDAIQEEGGYNLYAFVDNDVFNEYDIIGLCTPGHKRLDSAVIDVISKEEQDSIDDLLKKIGKRFARIGSSLAYIYTADIEIEWSKCVCKKFLFWSWYGWESQEDYDESMPSLHATKAKARKAAENYLENVIKPKFDVIDEE
ncbi:RHS repeat domain-containing protein [Rubritalea tangerina]|uniref:RHS repeat domain-containing protein n=1 Tax=Rubritalea tangerina TaxID=430798 RepID=A0ABW4ZBR0_9BACT